MLVKLTVSFLHKPYKCTDSQTFVFCLTFHLKDILYIVASAEGASGGKLRYFDVLDARLMHTCISNFNLA